MAIIKAFFLISFICVSVNAEQVKYRMNMATGKNDLITILRVSTNTVRYSDTTGTVGDFTFDSTNFYGCVNTNTWKYIAWSSLSLTPATFNAVLVDDDEEFIWTSDGDYIGVP